MLSNGSVSKLPPKPFWKRKRWIAAALLWLVIAYPASMWPASYLAGARFVDDSFLDIYQPLAVVMSSGDEMRFGFGWYSEVGACFYKLGGRLRFDFVNEE